MCQCVRIEMFSNLTNAPISLYSTCSHDRCVCIILRTRLKPQENAYEIQKKKRELQNEYFYKQNNKF